MVSDDVVFSTPLSPETCWERINTAQSEGSAKLVGYALSSVVDVATNGDQFELRHTEEPAVFTGTLTANQASGAIIAGRVAVPARTFYLAVVLGTLIICILLIGVSTWDLIFGTRHQLTRKATELGQGHPANFEQHIAVFILVPVVLVPVLTMFGPKARRPSAEARKAMVDFLHAMFGKATSDVSTVRE